MRGPALRIVSARLVSAVVGLGPIAAMLCVAAWAYTSYWLQLSEAADSYRMQIRKVGWIAENAGRLTRDLASANRALGPAVTKGSDASDQDLAARLQSNLKSLLDEASLQISSIQAAPIRKENGLRFISLRAQANGSYDRIVGFLRSLEGAPPNLIDTLDLVPDPAEQAGAGISAGPNFIAQLEVVHLITADK